MKNYSLDTLPFVVSDTPAIQSDITVKKLFIKRNRWDNYGLFVGTKKVYDGADKRDITDYAAIRYPNAEIIDKTI